MAMIPKKNIGLEHSRPANWVETAPRDKISMARP